MAFTATRTYRPSAFMRIQIRLEDFTKGGEITDLANNIASEAIPYKAKVSALNGLIKSLQSQLASEQVSASGGSPDTLSATSTRAQIHKLQDTVKSLKGANTKPRAQPADKGDPFSVDLYTVPVDLQLEVNSFRIADTLKATFPFIDAPLISDIVRAALVEVWMGTISPEEFADPDNWRLKPDRAVIMFRGYIDEWESEHDGEDAKVQISARSLEAILMDAKINPMSNAYRVSGKGEPISKYIDRILGLLPATSGKFGGNQLKSKWYGADPTKEPQLSAKVLLRSLQTAASRNAAQGGQPDGPQVTTPNYDTGGTDPGQLEGVAPGDPRLPPKAPGQEMSVWDLFTQACELVGCMPYYDPSLRPPAEGEQAGDYILLRPAQTVYQDVNDGYRVPGGPADDFNRQFYLPQGAATSEVRFMVWGHNIKNFKTSRKLGRVKVPAIRVQAYVPDAQPGKRSLVAQFPPESVLRATRIGAKGEGATNEVKTVVVQGIRSQKELEQYAVHLYHAIGRQELSVKLETDDLASYIDPSSGLVHNDERDLLRLRSGAPCRVVVAREVRTPNAGATLVISPLSEVFEKRGEQLLQLLINQNGRFRPDTFFTSSSVTDPFTAVKRIQASLGSAKLTDVFYCRGVSHKFNTDDGWGATIELVNYLTARNDPSVMPSDAQQMNDDRMVSPNEITPADKNQKEIANAVDRLHNFPYGTLG